MIPNIFISSTVQDLHYLRDAIRELIEELSYKSIMSEYGDIGFLPNENAVESCYRTIQECDLAILIIGKRYSNPTENEKSVTHNEFIAAKDNNIPIISLVEEEVLSFKKVYDHNHQKGKLKKYPGMDNPELTFGFIKEVMESPMNNGILPFSNVSEARNHLKKQFAILFGNLLKEKFDNLKIKMNDVLSEIKTIRYELTKDKGIEPIRYLRAQRFLLADVQEIKAYRQIIEFIAGDMDTAMPYIIKSSSFEELLIGLGAKLEMLTGDYSFRELFLTEKYKSIATGNTNSTTNDENDFDGYIYGLKYGNTVSVDEVAKKMFENVHRNMLNKCNS